jgi:hypothetical protein
MKRLIVAVATSVFIMGGGAAIAAASSAGPEVDIAKATIQLEPAKFVPTRCAGEDGINYVTYRGTWRGGETDGMPGSTDYNLSGPLTVKGIVWTINLTTQRGVLRGVADLRSDSAKAVGNTYVGPITLITQGLPAVGSKAAVTARGFINAKTYSPSPASAKTVLDGGSLLANVEFQILPSFAANGEFGGSMGFPDYSVTTNNVAC